MEKEHGDLLPLNPTPAAATTTAVNAGDQQPLQQSTRSRPKRFVKNQIPDSILNDAALNAAISLLPQNYNFEIHKCVWRVRTSGAKRVALQFPEGLLMYSLIISDILSTFTSATHCFILGDVTFGACCVDDLSAGALSADLLIHFGHSCLAAINVLTSRKNHMRERIIAESRIQ
ncbi:2-(3-amino-3-carboxypropyl)histidine synthase subunit 1-like [Solanum stenotomum]|uniref:2-(3-amino-3-carboxypropyl)histidine synthase subunit 1-like n=1 Tax=Solanum stenotomum TaxID=172797 RepID=UPI0020D093C6|nr:2-(3-amino-3-carboxypropyl)histidine synthase subunit 1-like [Solanum stenotomum]